MDEPLATARLGQNALLAVGFFLLAFAMFTTGAARHFFESATWMVIGFLFRWIFFPSDAQRSGS